MAAYQQIIKSKLTSIFEESRKTGDWAACWLRVNQLVTMESDRSFKNGIRWAKRNRIGRFPVQYPLQRVNDDVVEEEIEVQ